MDETADSVVGQVLELLSDAFKTLEVSIDLLGRTAGSTGPYVHLRPS